MYCREIVSYDDPKLLVEIYLVTLFFDIQAFIFYSVIHPSDMYSKKIPSEMEVAPTVSQKQI